MGSFPSSELTPTSWRNHLHISETWLHHCVNPVVLRSASPVAGRPVLQGLAVMGTCCPTHTWASAPWELPLRPSHGARASHPAQAAPHVSHLAGPHQWGPAAASSSCWGSFARRWALTHQPKFPEAFWAATSTQFGSGTACPGECPLLPLPFSSSHTFSVLWLKYNCCSWVATAFPVFL